MKRLLISTTLSLVCAGAVCQQAGPTLSSEDLKAASTEYQNYISPRLTQRNQTLATSAPYFSDGARGYEVVPSFEIGTLPTSGDRVADSALLLGAEACQAQAVVTGEAQASATYPISGDRGIVTAWSFKVTNVLQGSVPSGSTVTAVEFGGEIRSGSTVERVAVRGATPFKAGQQYLLFLNKAPAISSAAFFLRSFERVGLNKFGELATSGRPSDEIITNPVRAGDTIASFTTRISTAKAKFAQTQGQNSSCQ